MSQQEQASLCEILKRLGYGRSNQIRLYGQSFDLTSDPIVVADQLVFVDAVEQRSGRAMRIRIPLTILKMASQRSAA